MCDAHTIGSFYEAFDAETARGLAFRHTSKHGSWLNIAENELSALTGQRFQSRRFATIDELSAELTAWHEYTNNKRRRERSVRM